MAGQSKVRNSPIIAHIDHGKSTLFDRLIEKRSAVFQREMESQLPDNMDLERGRGITIKAWAVKLSYQAVNRETYELNLIDTPGHMDFNYEVSRSLAVYKDAVLIMDAAQDIGAQTLTNTFLALEHDLEILSVVNKIDPPAVDPGQARDEIENIIGLFTQDTPEISARVGLNIDAVLEDIVKNVPAPKGDPEVLFHALILDSQYDACRGMIVYFRVMEGTIKTGTKVKMMTLGASYEVLECGHLSPLGMEPCGELITDEVGYFTASAKNAKDTQVGDIVAGAERPVAEALSGHRPIHVMVYCGIYIEDGSEYPDLRDALEKLRLNSASLSFEPEPPVALGFGFRCGFLGMLHMEIIQGWLEQEFDLDLITILLSVVCRITKTDGTVVVVDNPRNYPDPAVIELAEEPYTKVSIVSPPDYVDNIMLMCQECQGELKDMQYLNTNLMELYHSTPLGEIIYDFFDTLKAHTKDYASLDYELDRYESSELVKVDMLFNGDQVDALSFIAHREKVYSRVRRLCEKLRDSIPRQLFEMPIQAAIGGEVVARETVRAVRKDVLAKYYGGDITRKEKLPEKQKKNKKKMRSLEMVQVPAEAFMAVLKLDEE